MIQSTPAPAAARVDPAPREWMPTRKLRRCASATTAAISSFASICDSPEGLSAILLKLPPFLLCGLASVTSDAVAFDDDGIVAYGLLAGAVDQGAIADHQGLLACGTHEDPPRGLFRTNVTAKPVQFSTAISASPAPEFVAPCERQRHPGLPAYRFAHPGYWAAGSRESRDNNWRRCEPVPDKLNIPRWRGIAPWPTNNTTAR